MRRPPLQRALLATFVVFLLVGAGIARKGSSSDAAAPGLILFASDRAKSNPGEIYSLAPGTAPRSVSRSLAADYGLAVAPAGDLIAFWSSRSGADRLYLARSDGTQVRVVAGVGGDPTAGTGNARPPVFSAGGSRLFATDSVRTVVIDPRRGSAREIEPCASPQPSPDGLLVACGASGRTRVSTLAGKLRFSFKGEHPLWSSRGDVTNAPQAGYAPPPPSAPVYDRSGRLLGRVQGQPLGWSPDGRWLVLTRGKSLRVADRGDLAHSRMVLAGQPGAVSFTPDSRYVSTSDAKGRRLLIPLAGGRAVRGLDGGAGVWSRDGRLAYVDDSAVFRSRGRPGSVVSVRVTDTHGRNPRVVGRFPFDVQAVSTLRWLPGGRRVLYSTVSRCSGSGLFAVSSAGGAARPLTHDPRDLEMPTWAPAGGRIAYTVQDFSCSNSTSIHLETISADGQGRRSLTKPPAPMQEAIYDIDPAFSPDGARVAFVHVARIGALQTVASGGGASTQLRPPNTACCRAPTWSPDGSKVAYLSDDSIRVVAASGGAPQVIAKNPAFHGPPCGTPSLAWSPDGKQLAVGGGAGIYLLTIGRPGSAKLAIRARCAEFPSFSPDGTQIAFDAQPGRSTGGQTAIMVARSDGSDLRTLSTVPFRQSVHPTWQPGG